MKREGNGRMFRSLKCPLNGPQKGTSDNESYNYVSHSVL